MILPPERTQVLVIGAGPGGSYAASVLAREGIDVAVLEADKLPRYRVGESLIPSARPFLRFIDAESIVSGFGFVVKPGSAIKFTQFKREGYTDFVALGLDNNTWNVVRSEFDHLLMSHARVCGASVHEQTKVIEVIFSDTDPERPVSVKWIHTPSPSSLSQTVSGTTAFQFLIDASGRAGIMSTKYLKNRHFNESLKNIAVWGYWKDVGSYGTGTTRVGAPWFEALTDESGWAWFIPLHNGDTSVGVVIDQKIYNSKVKFLTPSPFDDSTAPNPSGSRTVTRYLSSLAHAPGLVNLIKPAGHLTEGSVKSASDFSYSAPSYAGKYYRIIGDAGAFIDPFFSSGIHLAFTSALSASATICASLRGDCTELEAALWHTFRFSTSYTRFQIVVLSAYKQIRAQDSHLLSDIDEDNYDRAFSLLRPILQGAGDMGRRLSESELQTSLDFCKNIFNPTTPEDHKCLLESSGMSPEQLDVTTPLLIPSTFDQILSEKDTTTHRSGLSSEHTDGKMAFDKVNARRVIQQELGAVNNMESEPLMGFVMRLENNCLGLTKISANT